jgi:phage baseplate assembly protein W
VNRILNTPLGAMPMNREMGTQLHRLVFESDEVLIRQTASLWIIEQLKKNEPRIQDVVVRVYFVEDGDFDANTKYTATYGKAAIINVAYTVKKYQVPQVIRRPLQLGA